MGGWTKHQSGRMPIPKAVYGRAGKVEGGEPDDTSFTLDKSGLYLPETAAKERRKVKTGFQPAEEA